MSAGRVIAGPWNAPSSPAIDPAPFQSLVDKLNSLPHDDKGNPTSSPETVTRLAAAAVRAVWAGSDDRAKCQDCGAPATREDGLCSGCRRQRGSL